MEVWTWIVAYIVGFSLLQLLVYRYFRDSEPSVEGSSAASGERYGRSVERLERDPSGASGDDADGVYCKQCGAYNDREATYRYCKDCVAPIR